MFLIDAIKPNGEKKIKTCLLFTRLFRGGKSGAYKIKAVWFLYAIGLLAATKALFKRNEKTYYQIKLSKLIILFSCKQLKRSC